MISRRVSRVGRRLYRYYKELDRETAVPLPPPAMKGSGPGDGDQSSSTSPRRADPRHGSLIEGTHAGTFVNVPGRRGDVSRDPRRELHWNVAAAVLLFTGCSLLLSAQQQLRRNPPSPYLSVAAETRSRLRGELPPWLRGVFRESREIEREGNLSYRRIGR